MSEEICTLLTGAGPFQPGQRLQPDPEEVRHLLRVRRLRPGREVWALSGKGEAACCRLVDEETGALEVVTVHPDWREPARRVTLCVALVRPAHMDTIVAQGTALGMHALVPLLTERVERSGVRLDRWSKLARESVKQCGRGYLPVITPARALEDLCAAPPDGLILLDARADQHLGELLSAGGLPAAGPCAVVVGPEGGLTLEERERLRSVGARTAQLGSRRLRTETAAIAALTLLNHH